MTTKTFPKRFNAQRAARSALRNPAAMEGVDFTTTKTANGEWKFRLPAQAEAAPKATKPAPAATGLHPMGKPRVLPASAAAEEPSDLRAAMTMIGTKASPATVTAPTPAATKKPVAKRQPGGKRAEAEAAARAGSMPVPPDFSAETHKRFRKRLGEIGAMAEAGDIKGLKADTTEPKSSSRAAMCRYRDLCILALEARAAAAKAA